MATLKNALTEEDIGKMKVADVRWHYLNLSEVYMKIKNKQLLYCPACGEFQPTKMFYESPNFPDGYYWRCKKCTGKAATDYDKYKNTYSDNKAKTKDVLKDMDLPFIESLYESSLTTASVDGVDKQKRTGWLYYITSVRSLQQYKNKTWKDSEFNIKEDDDGINENSRIVKSAKKRFGDNFTNVELVFLENEYQDWVTRYECNTKAQEEIFELLSLKKLERVNAVRKNQPTKDIDKSFQELLNTANITPKQSIGNAFNDNLTFGQLIEKWEEEKPVPEPDPEFKDVNGIGKYLRVWFSGHLSKSIGLKNIFSKEYEDEIAKYTVTKNEVVDDNGESVNIYNELFGSADE